MINPSRTNAESIHTTKAASLGKKRKNERIQRPSAAPTHAEESRAEAIVVEPPTRAERTQTEAETRIDEKTNRDSARRVKRRKCEKTKVR